MKGLEGRKSRSRRLLSGLVCHLNRHAMRLACNWLQLREGHRIIALSSEKRWSA